MPKQHDDYITRQIQAIKSLLRDRNYEGAIHAATTFLGAIPDEEEVQTLLAEAKQKFIAGKMENLDAHFPAGRERERVAFLEKLKTVDPGNRAVRKEIERLQGAIKTQKAVTLEQKLTVVETLQHEGNFTAAWKALADMRKEFSGNAAVKKAEQALKRAEARILEQELAKGMTQTQKQLRDAAKNDRKKFRKI